jgi:uncharacterized protein YlxW (UPF0749 family)
MNKKGVCLTLGIMCAVLTYGICMQMKTVRGFGVATGGTSTQNKYKEDILKTKEKYDNVYRDLEHLNKELEKERANATQNDTELAKIEEEIKQINKLLGLTDVSGKGVKIVLKDSSMPASNYFGESSDLVVHDKYIMHIVNELYNAGAEAISINDVRVVSTSSIQCDGNVIKIGGERIGSPFEIKAIGYPEYLYNLNRPGGRLEKIRAESMIDPIITKENEIKIPKYTGTLKFEYINKK